MTDIGALVVERLTKIHHTDDSALVDDVKQCLLKTKDKTTMKLAANIASVCIKMISPTIPDHVVDCLISVYDESTLCLESSKSTLPVFFLEKYHVNFITKLCESKKYALLKAFNVRLQNLIVASGYFTYDHAKDTSVDRPEQPFLFHVTKKEYPPEALTIVVSCQFAALQHLLYIQLFDSAVNLLTHERGISAWISKSPDVPTKNRWFDQVHRIFLSFSIKHQSDGNIPPRRILQLRQYALYAARCLSSDLFDAPDYFQKTLTSAHAYERQVSFKSQRDIEDLYGFYEDALRPFLPGIAATPLPNNDTTPLTPSPTELLQQGLFEGHRQLLIHGLLLGARAVLVDKAMECRRGIVFIPKWFMDEPFRRQHPLRYAALRLEQARHYREQFRLQDGYLPQLPVKWTRDAVDHLQRSDASAETALLGLYRLDFLAATLAWLNLFENEAMQQTLTVHLATALGLYAEIASSSTAQLYVRAHTREELLMWRDYLVVLNERHLQVPLIQLLRDLCPMQQQQQETTLYAAMEMAALHHAMKEPLRANAAFEEAAVQLAALTECQDTAWLSMLWCLQRSTALQGTEAMKLLLEAGVWLKQCTTMATEGSSRRSLLWQFLSRRVGGRQRWTTLYEGIHKQQHITLLHDQKRSAVEGTLVMAVEALTLFHRLVKGERTKTEEVEDGQSTKDTETSMLSNQWPLVYWMSRGLYEVARLYELNNRPTQARYYYEKGRRLGEMARLPCITAPFSTALCALDALMNEDHKESDPAVLADVYYRQGRWAEALAQYLRVDPQLLLQGEQARVRVVRRAFCQQQRVPLLPESGLEERFCHATLLWQSQRATYGDLFQVFDHEPMWMSEEMRVGTVSLQQIREVLTALNQSSSSHAPVVIVQQLLEMLWPSVQAHFYAAHARLLRDCLWLLSDMLLLVYAVHRASPLLHYACHLLDLSLAICARRQLIDRQQKVKERTVKDSTAGLVTQLKQLTLTESEVEGCFPPSLPCPLIETYDLIGQEDHCLPSDWSIVSIHQSKERLRLCQRTRHRLSLSVWTDTEGVLEDVKGQFREISTAIVQNAKLQEADDSLDVRYQWWSTRLALDQRVQQQLDRMSRDIIRGFQPRWMEEGGGIDACLQVYENAIKVIGGFLEEVTNGVDASAWTTVDRATVIDMLRMDLPLWMCVDVLRSVLSAQCLRVEQRRTASPSLLNAWAKRLYRVLQNSSEKEEEEEEDDGFILRGWQQTVEKRPTRHTLHGGHVLLLLDEGVQTLPWESMSLWRKGSMSRLFNLAFVVPRLPPMLNKDTGVPLVNPSSLYYLINPNKDLKATEGAFAPLFTGTPGWRGTIGEAASSKEIGEALEQVDVFVYMGHNAGDQYVGVETMRRLRQCPTAILVGCSSGRLKEVGDFEPYGPVQSYLLAGSMAVVANLWDVTDKEIDRYAKSMMQMWGLLPADEERADDPPKTLTACVNLARDQCEFKYLVGAAPVVYGVPVMIKKQ